MSRIAKLYRKMLERRSLTFTEFCRLLEAFGYRKVRQTGGHIAYHHDMGDTRVIQPRGKDAKPYQVEQFVDMIEKLGLTLDDRP